jgi:putative ABC transport system permease protein
MSRLLRDIRYAFRTMLGGRFVTVLALLAFALGIGVTTAVFTIFNGVLLTPLGYPEPDALVMVYDTQPALNTAPASFPKYHDWRSRQQVFSAMGGSTNVSLVLTGAGDPERVTGVMTTASMVDVLGVQPMLGRWYREDEDQAGAGKVVVLGYGFWNRKYNRDPGILGRRLLFDGQPYEVIGVMPETFVHRGGEVYVPLQRKLDPTTRGNHFMPVYARLKPGVSVEQAAKEMRAIGEGLAKAPAAA